MKKLNRSTLKPRQYEEIPDPSFYRILIRVKETIRNGRTTSESVAAVNWWDDAAKLLWLRVRPTGRAQTALKRLPEATKVSYEATAEALTQRFEPASKRELYTVEFQSKTKVQEEG